MYIFRRPLILLVIFYVIVLVVCRFWQTEPLPVPAHDLARQADGSQVVLKGCLVNDPERRNNSTRFVVKARQMQKDIWQPPVSVQGKALVYLRDEWNAGWGDEVELRGTLTQPLPSTVPGGFDYRGFLAQRHIHSLMYVSAGQARVSRQASWWSPWRIVSCLRRKMLNVFDHYLSPHAAALLSGVALGKKPAGFPEMDQDFRASGTYHLLVASGTNVGFVIVLWLFVGHWVLFLPRKVFWAFSMLFAFLYAGIAGADPPVVRAAVMVSLGIVGYLFSREDRLEHAVFFSMGILLICQPLALFEAGFQMSYAATLGVVMCVKPMEALVKQALRKLEIRNSKLGDKTTDLSSPLKGGGVNSFNFDQQSDGSQQNLHVNNLKFLSPFVTLCRPLLPFVPLVLTWLFRIFLCSFAAQLALAPLLIHYFHRMPWVGLFANMLAVPWTGLCLGLGAGLFFLDLALPSGSFLCLCFAAVTEKVLRGLWGLVGFFADLPSAEIFFSWNNVQTVVLAVLVSVTLIVFARHLRGWKWVLGLWLVGLPVIGFAGWTRGDGALSVAWLDMGAGDSVVVTTPKGHVSVVDAGGYQEARYRLIPFLRSRCVKKIERLVLTHGDPPHAEGLVPLFNEFSVKGFYCTKACWHDPVWADTRKMILDKNIPVTFIQPGDVWEQDGVKWTIIGDESIRDWQPAALKLAPCGHDIGALQARNWLLNQKSVAARRRSLLAQSQIKNQKFENNSHDNKIMFLLQHGDQSALLTGDLPRAVQTKLIDQLPEKISVVQWPHHGNVRPDFGFLAAGRPDWTVVSGKNVKDFVSSWHVGKTLVTGQDGTIEWISQEKTSSIKTYLLGSLKAREYISDGKNSPINRAATKER